jgi:multidrug efflux pump subunit AcrA (membrane-fusion protein)
MLFLRRSLTGVFLLAVTVGLIAVAGQTIRGAVQTMLAEEDRQRPARERVFAADVLPVEMGQIAPELTGFGEVRSRRTLELRAQASGRIVTLSDTFVEGGRVQAGDLLLQVDPTNAQAALDVARTDLSEAQAEERDAATNLDLAYEDVLAAEEQLELRTQALNRAAELLERRVGTEAAVESAVLSESSAKQSLVSRRQALAQAEARAAHSITATARAQIALAEAERRLAETKLFAEFSGTLSNVTVVQGGLVQNNERLAELVDPAALEVAFRVSTSEYARLLDDAGQLIAAPVTATLEVFGADLTASGTIAREGAAVGEGLTGRLLFAQLETAQGFRPGDFVTLSVAEPVLNFAAVLPATAVDAQGTVLLLGADDRLELAQVNVLRRQGDNVIIRSPDVNGREVVAARTPLLGAGIKVRPLRPTDNAEPEAQAMLELTDERRARLVAFIEGNKRMPAEAKERVLATLARPKVPANVVERIEARMGG